MKDLVDESSAEGMIDVLREERAGDVNLWEMQEEEEKAEEPSTPEKVDKSIDVAVSIDVTVAVLKPPLAGGGDGCARTLSEPKGGRPP